MEYDPCKSQINDDKLAFFIQSPISPDLITVPGIGSACKEDLEKVNIRTTHQLVALYLSLYDNTSVGPVELTDKFYIWLKMNVPSLTKYRSTVVRCLAEKLNILFPGLYDRDAYDDA